MMNERPRRAVRTICIASSVVHHECRGRLYAYGAYAREIEMWADLFAEVRIVAPCSAEAPPGDALPLNRSNIHLLPLPRTGGQSLWAKGGLVLRLPKLAWVLGHAMKEADAVHIRCPGNVGLLGAILAPLHSRYRVAKYAGQWNGYAGEPFSVRFQRAVLGSSWWGAPVTVYGEWPGQARHVVPFFTSMMTAAQIGQAASTARGKRFDEGLRIVYSGRLVPVKRVDARSKP